jgi:hypothetical protein
MKFILPRIKDAQSIRYATISRFLVGVFDGLLVTVATSGSSAQATVETVTVI